MADTELADRIGAYLARLHDLVLPIRLDQIEPFPGFAPDEFNLMLRDISAAELYTESLQKDAAGTAADELDRILGAYCYMSTCHDRALARMVVRWRSESSLLRAFRSLAPSPPAHITDHATFNRFPNWGSVEAAFGEKYARAERSAIQDLVKFDRWAWYWAARRVAPEHRAGWVEDVWTTLWNKCVSGFPYYAFKSTFQRWWWQCLARGVNIPKPEVLIGDHDNSIPSPPVETATTAGRPGGPRTNVILAARQGHRIVRVTFFPRTYKGLEEIETLRSLIDDLWALWFERFLDGPDNEPEADRRRYVAERFPRIPADTIYGHMREITRRMKAFGLAFAKRMTNEQIRFALSAPKDNDAKQKSVGKSAFLIVASLTKAMPPGQSVLPAFAAHVALYPTVRPQQPDEWDFERFVLELWHWVLILWPDGGTRGQYGADDLAATLQKWPLLQRILDQLRTFTSHERVKRYLEEIDLCAARHDAACWIAAYTGRADWKTVFRARAPGWAKIAGTHWVVPVWFTCAITKVAHDNAVLDYLAVDEAEEKGVSQLAQAIRPQIPAAGAAAIARPGAGVP